MIVGWAILDDCFRNGKTVVEGKEWKTVQHHAEQAGILGYDFEKIYASRCAKAHEFKDKPEVIEAVNDIVHIFDDIKIKILNL